MFDLVGLESARMVFGGRLPRQRGGIGKDDNEGVAGEGSESVTGVDADAGFERSPDFTERFECSDCISKRSSCTFTREILSSTSLLPRSSSAACTGFLDGVCCLLLNHLESSLSRPESTLSHELRKVPADVFDKGI